MVSQNLNLSPSRNQNSSRFVSPGRKHGDSMRDILRDTNYGDRQRKNEILLGNSRSPSKKPPVLSIDRELDQLRNLEISPEIKVLPLTPSKLGTIYQGYSNDAVHLRNSSHHKKFSDVSDPKLKRTPNIIKSILTWDAEHKFNHKRTHSEVNFSKKGDWNIGVIDRNELEKAKLQNQNENGKYYFHREQRDAISESWINKSEQKDQYEQNLLNENKNNNNFKHDKVSELVEKLEK